MSAVLFEDFSFRYENLTENTLININLDIKQGEKVLIAGPSGSGKSTLAHCINGLIPFTYKGEIHGSIEVNGIKPCVKSLHEISEHVGTILQDQDCQFVGLSVGEDVSFAYENNCVSQNLMVEGVDKALREVDMIESLKETPYNLSGGQKQKVSIAGIIATETPILLFDEPLANLDPASGKKAMETINEIHDKTNKTIIIIEHRIEDVLEHNFDRIIVMNKGQIIADAHPDDVLTSNILSSNGLREPLYVEMLKILNIDISQDDKLSKLKNTIKFKDRVIKGYHNEKYTKYHLENTNLLTLENVSYKYFQDMPYTVKNVSFTLKKGEVLAVVGNNGAGKSTILKIISGIAKPQEGDIQYSGMSIKNWSIRKRAESIGYVMQNPNHMITKNMIFDEIAFGPRNFGCSETEVKERVEEALRICGLFQYRKWPVSSLSYGQRKRVTIASILSMRPNVIILDEPTAGQDHNSYKEFMGFLEKIKESGVGIILITHDMHLALEYADRAVVLSDGKVIEDDSVENVLSNSEIIKKANLKHTSIAQMAELYEIPDVSSFISYFTFKLKGEETYEQDRIAIY